MSDLKLSSVFFGLMIGIGVGSNLPKIVEPLPPIELKELYLIDGEDYKPVNVLGCIHLQTSRKSIHAWSLCRNKIHFNK